MDGSSTNEGFPILGDALTVPVRTLSALFVEVGCVAGCVAAVIGANEG